MRQLVAISIITVLTILGTIPASASTFTFGDSKYTLVKASGISWDAAKIAAENAGGHLATITSAAESNFLKTQVFNGQNKAYWLGAFQTGDSNRQNPTSNWNWVTNEDWTYSDWSAVEPNNAGIDEMHLSADSRYNFKWNDEGSAVNSMINGYVIETPNSTPTPIPGAIWILGASLATLFGIKRKFNK